MASARRGRLLLLIAVVTLIADACQRGVSPVPEPRMEQRVAFGISRGLRPSIRWTPASGLGWIQLARRDKDQVVWAIQSKDSTNCIKPPIQYGVTPPTAEIVDTVVPLEPGVQYELNAAEFRGSRLVAFQIARVHFIPTPHD